MGDPYETLGVARGSSESDVRRRYLELVRQFPPDRAPAEFAEIRKAYERLRDPEVRLRSMLFELSDEDSMPAVVAEVRRRLRAARIPTRVLLSLAERQ